MRLLTCAGMILAGTVGAGALNATYAQEETAADGAAVGGGGFLGVQLSEIPPALAVHLGVDSGVLVREVLDGTPARSAGVQRFDVVVKIDGAATQSPEDVVKRVATKKPGDAVTLMLRRGADTVEVSVELGSKPLVPAAPTLPEIEVPPAEPGFLGVGFGSVPPLLSLHLKLDEGHGVLVGDVWKDSPAASAGLEVNDIVLGINGKDVRSPKDLTDVLATSHAGDEMELERIHRGDRGRVTVTLGKRPDSLRRGPLGMLRRQPDRPMGWEGWRHGFDFKHPLRGRLRFRSPQGEEKELLFPKDIDVTEFDDYLRGALKDWNVDGAAGELEERLKKILGEMDIDIDSHLDFNLDLDVGEPKSTGPDNNVKVRSSFQAQISDGNETIEVRSTNGKMRVKRIRDGKTDVFELDEGDLDALPEDLRSKVKKLRGGIELRTPSKKSKKRKLNVNDDSVRT